MTIDSTAMCMMIFRDGQLIASIIEGLMCDISFVRMKYIKFVEMYVPYLRKFAKDHEGFRKDLEEQMMMLINCMCNLLKRVDVSSFSKASKKTHIFGKDQIRKNDEVGDLKNPINQEQDIIAIIDGFKKVLFTCLDIKEEDETGAANQEENVDEFLNEEEQALAALGKSKANANN